jgi:hypothetical protein
MGWMDFVVFVVKMRSNILMVGCKWRAVAHIHFCILIQDVSMEQVIIDFSSTKPRQRLFNPAHHLVFAQDCEEVVEAGAGGFAGAGGADGILRRLCFHAGNCRSKSLWLPIHAQI